METTLNALARILIIGAMLGLIGIILLGRWLDRQVHNAVFYDGMLVITLVMGGTLLLALAGY